MKKDKVEFFFFDFISKIFRLIGLKGSRRFGSFLGLLIYYLVPIRKSVVLQNLSKAFPEKSKPELLIITRKNYQNILITFFELMYFPYSTSDEIKSILQIEDKQPFEELLNGKKGVVFLTGHFGSWEAGFLSVPLKLGVRFNGMAKKQSNDLINSWLTNTREKFGNRVIWLGTSIRHLIEVLKEGGVVAVVGDQRGPVDNPRITFFNQPTSFYTGTATIIAKTNCDAIFGVAIRQSDMNYKANFERLDTSTLPGELNLKVTEINQRYASFLERQIRQYPEQYFWMHKIWKY
jgi:Kdo2-lipid IVA lauroyltransferase/acyltransferase